MSGCFYAIGGANYDKKESLVIDLDVLKECNKSIPKVLFIGAAQGFDKDKANVFKSYYESIGFEVDILNENDSIIELLSKYDVVYLSGGITVRLLEYSIKNGLKELLISYVNKGGIVVGVSAGAILMFDAGYGDKDAFVFNMELVNQKITNGLAIFEGVFCPHYQNSGMTSFHSVIKNYDKNGYAVENGASLKIKDNSFEVIKNKHSNAFLLDKNENHKLVYLKTNQKYSL